MSARRKPTHTRTIVVVAVGIFALVAGGLGLRAAMKEDTATVYAEFVDASPLIVGNDVKASGVKVGRVSSIEVVDGRARVGLHLDPEVLPIHGDAKVSIRPVSLLGERYVELQRGTPSEPALAVGATIPVSRTSRSVDLDEVLNAVDQPTGKAVAALLTTLGEGVYGHGENADATVRALAPALTDTQALLDVLDRQSTLLTGLVDQVQPVATAMSAEDGRNLDRLVTVTDRVLAVVRANKRQLAGALRELPGTLRSARIALSRLAGVADETTPTLRALRPTTGDLPEISEELLDFADAADPALASLPPVLVKAETLLDQAAPLAADLRQLGPNLAGTARSALPVADALLRRDLRGVMDFIRNWALTTNGRDGLSHYFRAHVVVSPETVTGLTPGGTPDAVEDLLDPPQGGDPGGVPEVPALPELPGLPALPGTENDVLGDTLGSITGLSRTQERSMMHFLVGGAR